MKKCINILKFYLSRYIFKYRPRKSPFKDTEVEIVKSEISFFFRKLIFFHVNSLFDIL